MSTSSFNDYILQQEPLLPILPLIHTTDAFKLRGIIDLEKLKGIHCKNFGEDLVYLFYGRPAYRIDSSDGSVSLNSYLPVCVILDPYEISSIKRLYPFDSGGFCEKMYEKNLHRNMKLNHFELEPDYLMPSRLVSAFYGSNARYYDEEVISPDQIESDPFDYEVQCYIDLINTKGKTIYDDRRSSVEVQVPVEVRFRGNSILAIVIPLQLLESDRIRNIVIKKWRAQVLTYKSSHARTLEYAGEIRSQVRNFLEKRNYLCQM